MQSFLRQGGMQSGPENHEYFLKDACKLQKSYTYKFRLKKGPFKNQAFLAHQMQNFHRQCDVNAPQIM